jgi:hypothetical protein
MIFLDDYICLNLPSISYGMMRKYYGNDLGDKEDI